VKSLYWANQKYFHANGAQQNEQADRSRRDPIRFPGLTGPGTIRFPFFFPFAPLPQAQLQATGIPGTHQGLAAEL